MLGRCTPYIHCIIAHLNDAAVALVKPLLPAVGLRTGLWAKAVCCPTLRGAALVARAALVSSVPTDASLLSARNQ